MHATIHMMCKSYRSVVLYRKEGPFSFSEPGPYRVWSTTYILRTSQHCTCESGSRDSVQETVIFYNRLAIVQYVAELTCCRWRGCAAGSQPATSTKVRRVGIANNSVRRITPRFRYDVSHTSWANRNVCICMLVRIAERYSFISHYVNTKLQLI